MKNGNYGKLKIKIGKNHRKKKKMTNDWQIAIFDVVLSLMSVYLIFKS
jgi:hypothetical protein